jgi:sodium/pantothenate symporter
MTIYIIGVLAIFALYMIVGNYAGSKVSSVEDYYVSGRNAPTLLILGTLVASAMSTVSFMGDAGWAYEGFFAIDVGTAMIQSFGFVGGAFLFGRFLRRSKALTTSEYFAKRFNSPVMHYLVACIVCVAIFGYLVSVTRGTAMMFNFLIGDRNYLLSLIVVWVVYSSFTFFGGSRGVLITDTMMFILFFLISVICAPLIITKCGGWDSVMRNLMHSTDKAGIMSFAGLTGYFHSNFAACGWMVATGLTWGFCFAVSPWQAGRYMMAKNEHVIMRTGSVAALFSVLTMLMITMSSVAINVVNPSITPTENVLIWASTNLLHPVMGILLLSGIEAAGLSTCSTFLQIIGQTFVRDIMGITATEGEAGQRTLKVSRIVMLVFSIVSLIVTYVQPAGVLYVAKMAGTVIAGSFGVVSIASVWSKYLTKSGAIAGICCGFTGSVLMNVLSIAGFSFSEWIGPFFMGTFMSLVGMILGNRFSTITQAEITYREALHVDPEGLYDPQEVKKTRFYPFSAIVVGLIVIVIMIKMYALPYLQYR